MSGERPLLLPFKRSTSGSGDTVRPFVGYLIIYFALGQHHSQPQLPHWGKKGGGNKSNPVLLCETESNALCKISTRP